MKSYPFNKFKKADFAGSAIPESITATTTSGVLFVFFHKPSTLMLYGSESAKFHGTCGRTAWELLVSAAYTGGGVV